MLTGPVAVNLVLADVFAFCFISWVIFSCNNGSMVFNVFIGCQHTVCTFICYLFIYFVLMPGAALEDKGEVKLTDKCTLYKSEKCLLSNPSSQNSIR